VYEPERFRSPEYLAVIDEEPATRHGSLSAAAIATMYREAERGYPLEVCGLLVGTLSDTGWQVTDVRPVANLNEERAADRFQLDPAGYQAVDRELRGTGLEIIGVYHSHPDCPARPSPTDLGSAWPELLYPIISIHEGKVADIRAWQLTDDGSKFQPVRIGS
jgi:proteasome lid subunit RPN8/RPN11